MITPSWRKDCEACLKKIAINTQNVGRVLTFALDAKEPLAALPKRSPAAFTPVELSATAEMIDHHQTQG